MMSVENVRVTATRLAPGTGAPPGAGAMRKLRPMVTERLTRRVLLGSTAALAIAAAAACTAPGGSASQAPQLPQPKKKVLSIGATLEPPTMDFTTSDAASIPQVLLYNVYETLVKLDAEGKTTGEHVFVGLMSPPTASSTRSTSTAARSSPAEPR